MKAYTVSQLAKMAGVRVRTLHHYHQIGLLEPSTRTDAGYRLYGQQELLRLQQILLFRELDMPLDEVMATFHEGHQRFVEKLRSLSQEDLERPYRHYQPDTKRNAPVWNWVEGNTFRHYAMHKRWIAAIVEGS